MKQTSETRGIILMLLSIVFFTVNTLAIRALALQFSACTGWQVTFFRGLAGTAVVLALYSRQRGLRLRSLIDRQLVIARGVLGAIGIIIFYITVIELGAARAMVMNLTYPIFATILAALILDEQLSIRRLIWIIVGFSGLMIFLSPKAINDGLNRYDFLALLGSLMAATVVILIRKLHQSEHGSTIFASQAVYCAIVALPISATNIPEIPLLGIAFLFVAGMIVAAGQLTMTFAYRHLEVSKGASLQMLLPIATGTGAWFLFGERFGFIELIGAALTLLATAMVNRQASKASVYIVSNKPTSS